MNMPTSSADFPSPFSAPLPNDPSLLRQMIVQLSATLRAERREREQMTRQLDELLRRLHARKTKQVDDPPLPLFDEPAVPSASSSPDGPTD